MNKATDDPWAQHRTLASHRGVGEAIVDAARYTSPEIYATEQEKILRRVWLLIGRESEIPNRGDFIKRTIYPLETDAVIVRGKDGVIRAFYNTCAHRGSAVVSANERNASVFVCPYHAWSYGTDGRCKAIPGAEYFPQVDKGKIGLAPIHVDVRNGFVFLNFDEKPRQTLKAYLGQLGEVYGEIPFGEFTYGVEMTQDIEGNWKSFLDASVEGYHVGHLHKKSLPMIPSKDNPLNVYYDIQFWRPHASLIIQSNPDWIPEGDVLKFVYAGTGATMVRPADGQDHASKKTKLSDCKGINPIGLPNFGLQVLSFFPFAQMWIFEDRYALQYYWPLGVDKTRYVQRFYFRSAPFRYLEEFGRAHMLASTRDVLTEDAAMTRTQHRSLKTGAMKRLHLGENELMIRYAHEMIQAYLNDP